ncbi:MAG: YfbM family protein [Stackebrandtia sp.]
MSMIGEFARFTPEQLQRAISDPQWAYDHVLELDETGPADRADPDLTDVDKAWGAIGFLLRRNDFPVKLFGGEEALGSLEWGYGPAGCLTPESVGVAAAALEKLPWSDLVADLDVKEMNDAEIYPEMDWGDEGQLEYVREHYESLSKFVAAAARRGDAMVTWMS